MNKKMKISCFFIFISCLFFTFHFLTYPKEKNHYLKDIEYENSSNYINYEEVINTLKEEYNNNDIIGTLKIMPNKNIMPIVQTTNNDYYLTHDLSKKERNTGAIFLDYRVDINKSQKLLIYAHSSKTIDAPFNFLEKYYDKNYYEENKYLELTTNQTKKRYEIFTVHIETEDFSYMQIDFENEEDYFKHINNLKEKSLYDTEVSLSKTDEIIILQTCSTHEKYKDYKKKYLLIIGRRV